MRRRGTAQKKLPRREHALLRGSLGNWSQLTHQGITSCIVAMCHCKTWPQIVRCLHQEFLKWKELPKQITNKPKRQTSGVRAIWYMPIVGKVPVSKVTKRFTQYRKAASILYFYAPEL